MDAFRLVQSDRVLQNNHVMACVDFLRSRVPYRTAGLVYAVENLPGSRGGELSYTLRDVSGCITLAESGPNKLPGVPKSRTSTQNMGVRTRRLLQMDAIHFAHDMGTYPCDTPEETARAARDVQEKLVQQWLAFEIDEHGRWTGKNGPSGRDDLGVAGMMAYYWYETFMESPAYERFRSGRQ